MRASAVQNAPKCAIAEARSEVCNRPQRGPQRRESERQPSGRRQRSRHPWSLGPEATDPLGGVRDSSSLPVSGHLSTTEPDDSIWTVCGHAFNLVRTDQSRRRVPHTSRRHHVDSCSAVIKQVPGAVATSRQAASVYTCTVASSTESNSESDIRPQARMTSLIVRSDDRASLATRDAMA